MLSLKRLLSGHLPFITAFGKLDLIHNKSYSNWHNDTRKLAKLAFQSYQHEEHNLDNERPPIIILHGLLGSKNNWNSMAKALLAKTKQRRIITVDLRNHGDSTHLDEFTYELMARDMVQFMSDEKIENAFFMGHSLGGRVSMLVAMMYPDKVENLIVVDISPVGRSRNMMSLTIILESLQSLGIDPGSSFQHARKHATVQLKKELKDDAMVNFIMTNFVEGEEGTNWRWKFNLDSIVTNFHTEVCEFPVLKHAKYDKLTLFVAGQNSDYIQRKHEPDIKAIFPSAQFYYIPKAGHWVHADKPAEFLFVVSYFINAIDSKKV